MRQWDVGTTGNITPGGINGSEGIVSKKLDALYRWPFQELDQSEESAPVAMRIIIMVSQP